MTESPISLPSEFLERLRQILPGELFDRCLAGLGAPRTTSFRVNTLVTSIPEALQELAQYDLHPAPVPWCPEAFQLPGSDRETLVHCAAVTEGRIYVQSLSSLLPILLLDPQPGETILDLAAAPGGKTLHIAARMKNQGQISAVEVIRGRYYRLRENLRRGQAKIVRTYLTDGRSVGRKTPQRFDRVLLDAPCSSEGRFRLDQPDTWQYWSLRKIREQARKQQGLLRAAMQAVRPGGTLVYCTCSFAPEENEMVVDSQCRRFPDEFTIQEIPLPIELVVPALTQWRGKELTPGLRVARRVLPQPAMDGFFLCKMVRSEVADGGYAKSW